MRSTLWKKLYNERARYNAEKQQVAEAMIEQLEKRFPGLTEQIEVVDVATPLTIERYTGNWQRLQPWVLPNASLMDVMKWKEDNNDR